MLDVIGKCILIGGGEININFVIVSNRKIA